MVCKFEITATKDGQTVSYKFDNELALNDFLLNPNNSPYIKALRLNSDIIYSSTPASLKVYEIIKENSKKYYELQRQGQTTLTVENLDHDLERYECNPPVLGVNKFLRSLEQSPGHPLFPVFQAEEFWSHKFDQLKKGYFTNDKEKQEIAEILGRSDFEEITDPAELDAIKKAYTKKWNDLGRQGNTTHKILELCFKEYKSLNKNFNSEKLKKALAEEIQANPDKYLEVPLDIINQTIAYAKELYANIRDQFGENAIILPEIRIITPLGQNMRLYDRKDKTINNYNCIQGIIDLLVISEAGGCQIIDYKTSPHDYSAGEYDPAKIKTFKYQLAAYRRILQRMGLNLRSVSSGIFLAPIKYDNFEIGEDGHWKYSGITPHTTYPDAKTPYHLVNLTSEILNSSSTEFDNESDKIQSHLDEVLPIPTTSKITPGETIEYVRNWMQSTFKNHSFGTSATDEEIQEEIDECIKNSKDGVYTYTKTFPTRKTIETSDKKELAEIIKKDIESKRGASQRITETYKMEMTEARKQGDIKKRFEVKGTTNKSQEWLTNTLQKYMDDIEWEMLGEENTDYDNLLNLGMILFKNKATGQIEVVKFTTKTITRHRPINGRKYLTGAFQSDIIEDNKTNSLILESTQGNIELMEAMAALNANPQIFDNNNAVLSGITVINPYKGEGQTATNKELYYNFKLLTDFNKTEINNFEINKTTGEHRIKMLTTLEKVRYELYYLVDRSIMKINPRRVLSAEEYETLSKRKDRLGSNFSDYSSLNSTLTEAIDGNNSLIIRDKLLELNEKLEKDFKYLKTVYRGDYNVEQKPEIALQQMIFAAISEIDGYDQRQQNLDDARYWTDLRKVLLEGHSGTYLDNQGFLSNPALNRLAKATTIAYQNTRNEVQAVKNSLRDKLIKLKEEKGYNWLYTRTFANQASLFHNMYNWKRTDDFMFANPDDLSGAEKDFLEEALFVINSNRLIKDPVKRADREYAKKYLDDYRYSEDENKRDLYFRVPLKPGSTSARWANNVGLNGLFNCLKDKLEAWNPKTALQYYKRTVEDFIDGKGEDQDRKIRENALWEMSNRFAKSEGNYRLEYLKSLGSIESCETNLEELVLEHSFAYSQQKNLDEIFPMIRATMMNVAVNEYTQNVDLSQTFEYIGKYVRNKIFNQSLISDDAKSAKILLNKVQRFASTLALAFSPAQLYQHLDGFWKDISLYIRKPDGDTSFTFKNLKDSYFEAYREMFHYGEGNSLPEQLNEFYGINDMDMNSYVEKIKSDQGGIWNFTQLAFRMSSRPDFYNRMVIFGAQMRGDGCWEAHSIVNGKLVYDFKKDKRFSLYANTSKKDVSKLSPDQLKIYNQQRSLYLAMAEQMIREHTRDSEGNIFAIDNSSEYPAALPKAYTTEQSEGMKALGDMIYGYYSHEKKSLWQGTAIGSLFMQMNTYWSSKKNQLLAPGGIKYMGRMEQYSEPLLDENNQPVIDKNGNAVMVKYWQQIDDNGNVVGIVSDTDIEQNSDLKNHVIPFVRWQGQFQEGIMVTLAHMFQDIRHSNNSSILGRFKEVHDRYYNHPDKNLRRAYRNNLRQALTDILAWLLIGCLFGPALEDAAKDYMKDNGNETFQDAALNSINTVGAHIVTTSGADFNAFKSVFGIGVSWTPFSFQMLSRVISNMGMVLGGDKSFYDAIVTSSAATRSTKPIWDYIKGDEDWGKSRNQIARENGELD